ncbi:hypothetical protein [Methylobacterium frigidaeris]|uniref:Uncharacterized protein n=1 Tax=Methylobacterium frigidaeris TaxID=2038277 RepID=A0AA37HHZ8_9HYPH|nr:hypothetical protein [Methylobacterium frigidaeris]PIK71354.1 hypothetical protein CS379_19800 [Methylobacterium frigidaeris]GJD66243.1 hypothetical protein MPEAHAMD_6440 [Methylobacterium frigidaeris]
MAYAEIMDGNEAALAQRLGAEVASASGNTDADQVVIGRALAVPKPREIVEAIFKTAPDGFLGLLRRLGADPLPDPTLYRELHRLFSSRDPADRARVLVLRQSPGTISPMQIAIVMALDPVLLHPRFVRKIETLREARDLNAALSYVRAHCSTATEEAVRQSVSSFPEKKIVEAFVLGWARRFDRLPFPLAVHDPSLVVLDTGAALVSAGRRYDNCLASKVPEVLVGRKLYVEVRLGAGRGVIAELRRTSRCWVLRMLHQRGNGRVPRDLAVAVRGKLAAHGIAIYDQPSNGTAGLDAAAKLLDIYDWRTDDVSEFDTPEPLSLAELEAELDDLVRTFGSTASMAEAAP